MLATKEASPPDWLKERTILEVGYVGILLEITSSRSRTVDNSSASFCRHVKWFNKYYHFPRFSEFVGDREKKT